MRLSELTMRLSEPKTRLSESKRQERPVYKPAFFISIGLTGFNRPKSLGYRSSDCLPAIYGPRKASPFRTLESKSRIEITNRNHEVVPKTRSGVVEVIATTIPERVKEGNMTTILEFPSMNDPRPRNRHHRNYPCRSRFVALPQPCRSPAAAVRSP